MDFLTDLIASSAVITVVLAVIAKVLPNEKVYQIGFSVGSALTIFGTSKLGQAAWAKIEDFMVNSFGIFFEGFGYGLKSDDLPTVDDPKDEDKKSPRV